MLGRTVGDLIRNRAGSNPKPTPHPARMSAARPPPLVTRSRSFPPSQVTSQTLLSQAKKKGYLRYVYGLRHRNTHPALMRNLARRHLYSTLGRLRV